jgi:hypothetical protein
MIDHLFPAVSLRDKINRFIENSLIDNNEGENDFPDNETTASGFVFIRRFPKFNEKTIEKHSELMHLGLVNTLNQCKRLEFAVGVHEFRSKKLRASLRLIGSRSVSY